ncbi:hypothetical protein WJX79_000632 [Trebouxia sp. C0005]
MAYNSNKAKTVRKPLFMTHRKSTKEEESMGGEHGDEKNASEESQAEDDPAEDHLAEAEPVAHETQSHEEPEDTKSDGEFEDGSEAGEGSEAEAEDGSEAEEPEARAGPAENAETVLGKRASKPAYKVAHQERQEDVNDAALGQEQPASKACKQPKKPKQPKQPSKEAKLPRKGSKKESKQPVVQRNSIPAKVASTAAAKKGAKGKVGQAKAASTKDAERTQGYPSADGDECTGDQGTSGHDAGDGICQDGLDRHAQKGAKAAKDQEAAKKAVKTAEEVAKVAAEGGTQPVTRGRRTGCARSHVHPVPAHVVQQAHEVMAEIGDKSLPSPTPKGKRPALRQLEGPQQNGQVAKMDVNTVHRGGAFKAPKAKDIALKQPALIEWVGCACVSGPSLIV